MRRPGGHFVKMKILILKPRAFNYRHLGYTNFLASIHRQFFSPTFGTAIVEADLPWWLRPDPKPITDPARLLTRESSC